MTALAIIYLAGVALALLWDFLSPDAVTVTFRDPARVLPTVVVGSSAVLMALLTLGTSWFGAVGILIGILVLAAVLSD